MTDTTLNVQISNTPDGKGDYLQIMSPDVMSLNIMLTAGTINVNDLRVRARKRRAAKKNEAP